MNNRKRMMLKSVEVFYGFGKLNERSRRMWLMYSAKRMAELLRQVRSGFREQPKQNDNQM
jgi:hypothetical protein